uniref:Uncharacterized protein n=1 Tax=Eucampia antarctica TaxID=49252 RepID=A0A7S2W805_9STRA|eukprot:CAMPEP_0197825570 /NCGR_PEP_ID=MMETSP1437-20131217/2615_1 /TAXON_ID=49252 ORGANISM="Eucampia antarctica, Strain CCMP1452" /NCGR_SAMPLE_ID=MMETSP1437 /ASSEMBLY_ACC=CAM_ASM_001096 /LENGTH=157 /DNA_ID=CAMNT_0043425603 /DNA_START=83 /DNA_END=556 /DNA_ORIENTATION=+
MPLNQYMGCAFQKGDEILVNIGWNTRRGEVGNRKFMHSLPPQLDGRVDAQVWADFVSTLEKNLEGKGVWCPIGFEIMPCCILPICPCWCYHMCSAKKDFDATLTQTIAEWSPKIGNGTALSWRLIQTGQKHDTQAAMGYNIIVNLQALPPANLQIVR